MNKSTVPKYAHLEYQVLHDLEISIAEYFFLDMVYRLSRSGWCTKKLDNIAFDMRVTQMGVIKMRTRLIERKLLIKGRGGRLKTSEKLNKVYFLEDGVDRKTKLSSQKLNKVYAKTKLSLPTTDTRVTNRLTKNNNADKKGINTAGAGYKAALEIRKSLVKRLS